MRDSNTDTQNCCSLAYVYVCVYTRVMHAHINRICWNSGIEFDMSSQSGMYVRTHAHEPDVGILEQKLI